jgi:hypothetical protein
LKKVAPAALLIHVGASWCEHCCPGLQAIRRIEGRNPGAVRLVFIDVEPDVKKGRAFRDQCAPGALALLDRFEVIAKSLGASEPRDGGPGLLSIPLTILVDARGIVRTIVKGQFPDLEALLEEDLRALPSRDAAPDGGPADAGR